MCERCWFGVCYWYMFGWDDDFGLYVFWCVLVEVDVGVCVCWCRGVGLCLLGGFDDLCIDVGDCGSVGWCVIGCVVVLVCLDRSC